MVWYINLETNKIYLLPKKDIESFLKKYPHSAQIANIINNLNI
jgi:hypothetical protein